MGGSTFKRIKKEVKRAGNRIKDDPTSALTGGASVNGNTLGAGGAASFLTEKGSEYIADITGLTAQQEQIEQERAAAQQENTDKITAAKNDRRRKASNRAASQGPSIRLGLSRGKTGAQS